MDVYADVLLLQNVTINYFIIWLTSKMVKAETGIIKIFTASAVGALYALLLFFPGYKVLYSIIMKVLLSFLIIVIAFTPLKLREFMKQLSVFYLISFILGGSVFGLFYLTNTGISIVNGIFLIKGVSPYILLGAGLLTLGFVRLCIIPLYNLLEQRAFHLNFSIYFGGNEISLKGLIDTGNSLYDPITNFPVIVVEYSAIRDIIPEKIRSLFEENREDNLEEIYSKVKVAGWMSKLRLIPFTSLGREKGMLLGFKADKVTIKDKEVRDIIIAIYSKPLSQNGEYKALLNPELLK